MTDAYHDLAEVLCWNEPGHDKLQPLEQRYLSALCFRLGATMARLRARAPRLAEEVEARIAALSDEGLVRLLLAPATSRRIVTGLHSLEDVGRHLMGEAAGEADGVLLGIIPVRLSLADGAARRALLTRVGGLAEAVAAASPPVGLFLRSVVRELVLREDPARSGFASNSPQGFVGRAIITNGHGPAVDDVMLVEALVHEATHGFVGMSEAVGLSGIAGATPWLGDPRPYDGVSRVVSPWTDRPLDIPTYLHACFVWWGLLHFWARMRDHPLGRGERARGRFFRALRGFDDNAFIGQLEPFRDIVAPGLMAVFEDMASALRAVRTEEAVQ